MKSNLKCGISARGVKMDHDILSIVCFKWHNAGVGVQLPSQRRIAGYTPEHVNRLFSMISRNIDIPFRPVCITDDPRGINDNIRCIPLWDKCRYLGGCFNRLYMFSDDMKYFIGRRFAAIDMDCVITGNVTPIFSRTEDFIMNSYQGGSSPNAKPEQLYNGALVVMDAGARREVWDSFDFDDSPEIIKDRHDRVGTDQAWIREVLGGNEARLGQEDGIYEHRLIQGTAPPPDARIVFFAGARDPSIAKQKWVKDLWV
jgi:hypothetical protein